MMLNRLIPRSCKLALASALLLSFVSGCATATNDSETIYIDPQTGAVTDGPTAGSQSEKQHTKHDKTANTSTHIIHCPDGSLRMGTPDDEKNKKKQSSESLCNDRAE